MTDRARAVTSVVSTVLLVAVVVVLAATISVYTLGATEEIRSPPPAVSDSSAEYLTGSLSCDDDIVKLTHRAGDPVDLSETRTIVRLPDSDRKEATITGFPTDGSTLDNQTDVDDPHNILSDNCVGGEADGGSGGSGRWAVGDSFSFKLNSGGGTGDINAGDTIEVIVVHDPSDAVVVRHSIAVSE